MAKAKTKKPASTVDVYGPFEEYREIATISGIFGIQAGETLEVDTKTGVVTRNAKALPVEENAQSKPGGVDDSGGVPIVD